MAKILWNINFSTLNVTNDIAYQGWDTKYTNNDNLTNGVYAGDGQGTTPTFSINAVEIDWNGAELDNGNTVINTTGEMLSRLNDTYHKNEIDEKISEIETSKGEDGKSAYEIYKESINEQDAQPAIYSFESWNNSSKDIKYGEGQVKVVEMRIGGATVEVIENNSTDPNAQDFVGQQFNVATGLETDEPIQLYNLDNEPINIWVTVSLISEAQDAIVAMTQEEWINSLKGEQGPQGPQGEQGPQGPQGETGTFDDSTLENYATKTYVDEKISEVVGSAPEALDTLKEISDKLSDNDDVVSALTNQISEKANSNNVYTKDEIDGITNNLGESIAQLGETFTENINNLTFGKEEGENLSERVSTIESNQESLATKTYVDNAVEAIVGAAPETLDTLKEIADALNDNATIADVTNAISTKANSSDVYTKDESNATFQPIGDYATQDDINNEQTEVSKVKSKYNALLSLLNLKESQVNSVIVNQELETTSNVTFDEPVDNVVIPETTQAYTVSVPLENDSTVTLTSNKYMTLFNTNEEVVSTTIQRQSQEGETGTSGTTVYLVGNYDTLTLENVSPNVKSGEEPAKVNNVVISENNTKNLTLALDIQDGATITNNSNTSITITDKNDESTVLTIVAPNSTVTLNGSTYETLNAEVSDNTLVIKKTAHINTLNVTKGNVKVEVPRESDINNIIENINIADGYSIDYLHDDITSENISKLISTGTHVLQEDIAKSGNFSVGIFSTDDIIWDLNGHNITSSNTRGYGIFTLRGSAHLEINDGVGTGTVKNESNEYGFWTSTVGSKVVINGGNFEAGTHVLYAQKGTIEVNGGTFKLTDAATASKDQNGNFKFLLNCHDEDYVSGEAKIIVRGGKFYGFNPAETYGEPNSPVSFVAEGYESVAVNEPYEYGQVYEVRPISE